MQELSSNCQTRQVVSLEMDTIWLNEYVFKYEERQ